MKKKENFVNYLKKGETVDLINLEPEVLGIIGVELKRRRRKQSRTLDSFDCGCSVSYISKIENGKITPKYSILQELCSEQGISQLELDSLMGINNLLEDAISATFYKKYDLVKMYCENIAHFDNYKVNMLKAIDYINHNMWDQAKEIIPSISIIEDKLSNVDYNLLIYLQMKINNHEEKFLDTHTLYSKCRVIDHSILNALCYKEYFISICQCGYENPEHYFNELTKMNLSLFYNHNLDDVSLLYFKTKIFMGITVTEYVLENLSLKYRVIYYIKHNKFKELLDLKEQKILSPFELLMIAMATKDYMEVLNQYYKLEFDELSKEEMILCNYCKLLVEGDDAQIVNYATNVIVPYAEEKGDYRLILHSIQNICNHSVNTGRYKNVAMMCMALFNLTETYQKYAK